MFELFNNKKKEFNNFHGVVPAAIAAKTAAETTVSEATQQPQSQPQSQQPQHNYDLKKFFIVLKSPFISIDSGSKDIKENLNFWIGIYEFDKNTDQITNKKIVMYIKYDYRYDILPEYVPSLIGQKYPTSLSSNNITGIDTLKNNNNYCIIENIDGTVLGVGINETQFAKQGMNFLFGTNIRGFFSKGRDAYKGALLNIIKKINYNIQESNKPMLNTATRALNYFRRKGGARKNKTQKRRRTRHRRRT